MNMEATQSAASRRVLTATLLDVAQLGHAHWLFGNVYEAVVKIPERLAIEASDRAGDRGNAGPTSVLGPGSPVPYYAPVAPVALASTAAAVIAGWGDRGARRWLTIEAERDARIRLWHRINIVRIATAGGALLAARKAQRVIATPRI